jgi:hypothetical protein
VAIGAPPFTSLAIAMSVARTGAVSNPPTR